MIHSFVKMNPLRSYILRETFEYPKPNEELTNKIQSVTSEISDGNSTNINDNSTLKDREVNNPIESTHTLKDGEFNNHIESVQNLLKDNDNSQHTQQYMIDKFTEHLNIMRSKLKKHNYTIDINQIKKPNGDYINEAFDVILNLIVESLEIPTTSVNELNKVLHGADHVVKKTPNNEIQPINSWISTKKKF